MSTTDFAARPASLQQRVRQSWRGLALLSLVSAMLLSACGFHLRGAYNLPYKVIYVSAGPNSQFGSQLRLYIRASNGTSVTENRKEAEAAIDIVSESRDQKILALSSQGRPREKELNYHFVFHVVRPSDNKELLAATTINLKRNVSYNESQELSSASQEDMLYKDMQSDVVQQILRRLSSITPEEAAAVGSSSGTPIQTVPTAPNDSVPAGTTQPGAPLYGQ